MDLGFARCVDNRKPQLALHCSGQQIIPEFMCHVSWKVKKKMLEIFYHTVFGITMQVI